VRGSTAHPPVAAIDLVTEQPAAIAAAALGFGDLQIEPAAIDVQPGLGAFERSCRQPIQPTCHVSFTSVPTFRRCILMDVSRRA
jgi:hypothetical protein